MLDKEHIRFTLNPYTRRNVEINIEKTIIAIYDDLNWTKKIRNREEDLKPRMEWIQDMRDKLIETLIWVLKE